MAELNMLAMGGTRNPMAADRHIKVASKSTSIPLEINCFAGDKKDREEIKKFLTL
jgi:hypothetical protein